ncbi:hypothetical protein [Corynebacterium epidermidicanis]|uniref:hypothetical protein n=1 Tax=Corynebacterium epidermidicanis TaxID=1050174 RepID=UPI00064139E9|nr:hypothetical protein [Corynebacterium epidermidicanis]
MTNRPLPDYIYRRRRIAALVVLLVIVALIVWLLASLGGGKGTEEQPQPTSVNAFERETAVATPTASTSPSPSPTASQSATPTPTGTPALAAADKTTCAVEDLIVEARANQPSFGPEDRPTFYLTVKNPTKADCKVDLRKDGLKFEVYDLATNHRVWGDTDCNPSEDSGERVFPAGQERHYEAIWSRTTSAPNACDNRQPVPPGSYFLHTLVGENHSEAFTFNVK